MWTGTIITVLFISIGAIADAKSITISNARLVSSRGGSCRQENGINRCSVIRGETATFQGVLNVDGGEYSHLGIESLVVTLEWTKEKLGKVVTKAQTCQKVGGDVVIKGECSVTVMAEGSYKIVPFPVRIPKLHHPIKTNFRALASAKWSDGSTTKEMEIGRCEVDIN
uniref:MD-2-related lipid-recognition domain-containing protein n=1 Tax=Homalodisca liturata TaxID=320908 RepID=A0A1B6JUP2_9HEMI